MSRIDQFVYNLINHSHAINCQTFQISHFQIHMHFHNIISKDILIPYNHFRFIWYSTKTLEIRIEVSKQTEAADSRFLSFDLGPRLDDPHPFLVNKNYVTLSG